MTITANEVKTKGVSIFEDMLKKFDELIINVRGKDKYIILDMERYNEFRQNELDLAYYQAMQDIENKNYKTQTADKHIKDLKNEL